MINNFQINKANCVCGSHWFLAVQRAWNTKVRNGGATQRSGSSVQEYALYREF
jgi:hypothetical protein